ncbi:MAG: hypothetical protein F4Z04_07565 [Acidobacteria bacterium]|nr:hypothetical protein [Acidobacteriota bacterium]
MAGDLHDVVRLGVLRFEGVSVRVTADDRGPEAAADDHAMADDGATADDSATADDRGPEAASPARADSGAPATSELAVGAAAEARVALVRAMYRRFGIDPTRTRPSSEALWRRIRRGLPWPRINTLVDACNTCSLVTQLPFGLYDLDRVTGPIVLRRGGDGDEYAGIGKPVVHVGGRPALYDAAGPFGNPTSDSARTMITPDAARALLVVYAPRPVPVADLEGVLSLSAARVLEAAGGTETGRWIIPSG